MELGDIVNICAPGGGYWKGKIVNISYAWEHTYKDGSKATVTYTKPIATVQEIDGPGHALVNEDNIRRRDNEWFEKEICEE